MKKIACHVVAKLLPTACAASVGLTILLTISPTASAETPSLRDTFKDSFLVGAALNPAQFTEEDARGSTLVKAQFNSISPENVLKWNEFTPNRTGTVLNCPIAMSHLARRTTCSSSAIRWSGTTRSPHGSFRTRMAIPQIAKHY